MMIDGFSGSQQEVNKIWEEHDLASIFPDLNPNGETAGWREFAKTVAGLAKARLGRHTTDQEHQRAKEKFAAADSFYGNLYEALGVAPDIVEPDRLIKELNKAEQKTVAELESEFSDRQESIQAKITVSALAAMLRPTSYGLNRPQTT
jgi:hypothetical protein